MHGIARELNVLILALKKLGNVFPIAGKILLLRYADLMHKVNRQTFHTGQHALTLEQERTDRCGKEPVNRGQMFLPFDEKC
jgi:hypothetical protein